MRVVLVVFNGMFCLFQIRESEEEWGVPHSFTLIGQRQSVVVAARYDGTHIQLNKHPNRFRLYHHFTQIKRSYMRYLFRINKFCYLQS